MKIFNDKAKKLVRDMITNTYPKIPVLAGECRYNFRCQMNTVHEAMKNKEYIIAVCAYIDNDYPIVHFINVSKKGVYTDNTLGYWATKVDYYLLNTISIGKFDTINKELYFYKAQLRNTLPFFIKLFSDVEF